MTVPDAKTQYPHHRQGEVFRTRREAVGKSQTDIARATGISNSTISKLERGRQDPNRMEPRTLIALAEALGWTIDELSRCAGVVVIGDPNSAPTVTRGSIDPSSAYANGVNLLMLENFDLESDGRTARLVPTGQQVAYVHPTQGQEFTAEDAQKGLLFAVNGSRFNVSLGASARAPRHLVLTHKDLHTPGDFVVWAFGQFTIQEFKEVPEDVENMLARGEVVGRVVAVIL
ncbi:helix-turn-helix domain-containing protein [Deinococcus petrolearius]|uniref:Helix-turn-helix domain-containing protein n=1 Tax=Deinococcus petrolearius TaxID=1751295 RepID=A0ABW1DGT8_9DEIO